ncbi:MAG: abortive infection system antitoxin AbiGi family protein [Bacteroidota bacterium]|nr:abortive infection system antitoxin AbiGi family protein [Bacteroidota bacterium]
MSKKNIKRNRSDLSDWIIHFVHDRSRDQRPEWIINPSGYGFGENGDEDVDEHLMAIEWSLENMNFDIEESDKLSAFEVLKLILAMGYIRAGFSYRNENKTIYGNRPAICFTEMPLHALIQYSKNRSQLNLTSSYAIAFPRTELFQYGARNVIYGLTGSHQEADQEDLYYDVWHRNLAESCGLGLHEQYRYVYTNLKADKSIDWTHEREWRLACDYGNHSKVGLNFLLKEEENNPIKKFSQIVVIVNTEDESEILLNHLAQYYHGDLFEYSTEIVERIKIISFEYLSTLPDVDFSNISIDNIDYRDFKKHNKKESTEQEQKEVIGFLEEAIAFADKRHEEEWDNWQKKGLYLAENGDYFDGCAFVNIVLDEPTKKYSNALIDIEYAQPNGSWGILLRKVRGPATQSSTIKRFYCENIIKKLTELTGEKFSIHEYAD